MTMTNHATTTDLVERAHEVADRIAVGAVERDRDRLFPYAQRDMVSDAQLTHLLVPTEFGGPGGLYSDAVRAIGALARGDSNVAQIFFVHAHGVELFNQLATGSLRQDLNDRTIAGDLWWTNAYSEVGKRSLLDYLTTFTPDGDEYVVNGTKFFCTGSFAGNEMNVTGKAPGKDDIMLGFIPTDLPGITIHDDWSAMGQRTTASGTITFEDVRVPAERIYSGTPLDTNDSVLQGLMPQNSFTAILIGIAEQAFNDAVAYVTERARPWLHADVEAASEDPYIIRHIGDLKTRINAAKGLLEQSLAAMDHAQLQPSPEARGRGIVAVAQARPFAVDTALDASSRLFQICGASSTLGKYGYDRHWRNARTLSLHDPVDYKVRLVGDHVLNDRLPPVTIYT